MKTTRRGLFGLLTGAIGIAALPKEARPRVPTYRVKEAVKKGTAALTVQGGVDISSDVYIKGNLYFTGEAAQIIHLKKD